MAEKDKRHDGVKEAAVERLGFSKAARVLAEGVGLDPDRGAFQGPDVSREDRQRLAEDPSAVDDLVARLRKKLTNLENALRNRDVYGWAVGLLLAGVIAAWIFQ